MAFVVVYDACVLYPAPLRDLLIRLGLQQAESGIASYADVTMLHDTAGIGTFLVGESLMRQDDVTRATQLLLWGDKGRP